MHSEHTTKCALSCPGLASEDWNLFVWLCYDVNMKLLLTSSGLSKRAGAKALNELVGKPPSETKVGYIPIAANVEEGNKDWYINQFLNFWRFGYNNIDIVDPSAADVNWRQRLADVDVIFMSGGNTFHLLNQIRMTGFDKWLNDNKETKVYVGVSAGTIVMTPTIEVGGLEPGADPNLPGITNLTGMGWVNFEIEPHCDMNRFGVVEEYAKTRSNPVYAIDDQTAIKVVDDEVEVVSEGSWKVFNVQ